MYYWVDIAYSCFVNSYLLFICIHGNIHFHFGFWDYDVYCFVDLIPTTLKELYNWYYFTWKIIDFKSIWVFSLCLLAIVVSPLRNCIHLWFYQIYKDCYQVQLWLHSTVNPWKLMTKLCLIFNNGFKESLWIWKK